MVADIAGVAVGVIAVAVAVDMVAVNVVEIIQCQVLAALELQEISFPFSPE